MSSLRSHRIRRRRKLWNQAIVRSPTPRWLPRPESCATPRRAMTGLVSCTQIRSAHCDQGASGQSDPHRPAPDSRLPPAKALSDLHRIALSHGSAIFDVAASTVSSDPLPGRAEQAVQLSVGGVDVGPWCRGQTPRPYGPTWSSSVMECWAGPGRSRRSRRRRRYCTRRTCVACRCGGVALRPWRPCRRSPSAGCR